MEASPRSAPRRVRPCWLPVLHDGELECCTLRLRYARKAPSSSASCPPIGLAEQRPQHSTESGSRVLPSPLPSNSGSRPSRVPASSNSSRVPDSSVARHHQHDPLEAEAAAQAQAGSSPVSYYVGWQGEDDKAAPRNWPPHRKWLISVVGFAFCSLASISVSGYAISVSVLQDELQCSRELALAGISVYTVTFGIAPLFLAPLSEVYGRRVVYVLSAAMYTMFQIPQAAANNITTMLVARLLSGVGGSTAISLVGGTLSDLFNDDERGIPMATFAFAAFAPTGLGPVAFGYTAMLEGFRLVFWVQFALAVLLTIIIYFVQAETRESVLLSRKAKSMRSTSKDPRFVAPLDEEKTSFGTMMKTTLTRPMRLLLTQLPIQAWTIYVSFAWAVLYLLLLSISIVYSDVYGFNLGEIGVTYVSQVVGSCLAMPISVYCDKIYRKCVAVEGPEARMYAGMVGGILVSTGAWIFAWTTYPTVHWIVPLVGVSILYSGLLQIYLTAFNYITDGYGTWASSALAASKQILNVYSKGVPLLGLSSLPLVNLGRNLAAAAVPLFGHQVYDSLGIHGAGSLVAALATALAMVPFAIAKYGAALRARSAVPSATSDT